MEMSWLTHYCISFSVFALAHLEHIVSSYVAPVAFQYVHSCKPGHELSLMVESWKPIQTIQTRANTTPAERNDREVLRKLRAIQDAPDMDTPIFSCVAAV